MSGKFNPSASDRSKSQVSASPQRAYVTSLSSKSGSSSTGVLHQSGDKSKSQVPAVPQRANYATSLSSQSGSPSTVLPKSEGTIQGLQNVYGNNKLQNVQWPAYNYASVNSVQNDLSQLSLAPGGLQGESGNVVLPTTTGNSANPATNLVFGSNLTGVLGSAGVANQAGASSTQLNLTASQMANIQANYAAQVAAFSQNQIQDMSNYYNYMAILNNFTAVANSATGINDYQQGQGFSQQNKQFNNQNEGIHALPDDLDALGFSEFPMDKRLMPQTQEKMGNLNPIQQKDKGKSPVLNAKAEAFPVLNPQQQHRGASGGFSHLNSASQALPSVQARQYLPFESYFTNQFIGKNVPDPFGLRAMLDNLKKKPGLNKLAVGSDLTTLGPDMNSSEPLYKTFASPWAEEPIKLEPEFKIPACYRCPVPQLRQTEFTKFALETLFYIFYSMPKDRAQVLAANELCNRGFFYHKEFRLWLARPKGMVPLLKTNTYERGSFLMFNPNTWKWIKKDNILLQYDKIERRPVIHGE